MDAYINNLMSRMTVDEKIDQLNLASGSGGIAVAKMRIDSMYKHGMVGVTNGYTLQSIRNTQQKAVDGSRLHIPLLFGLDVIHGFKTIFQFPLGLSCTWDTLLIEKSTRIAANEASTSGVSWTYSPMLDICRDPRWGRIAEGMGEDPWLASMMARAMVKGFQGDDLSKDNTILACVKHFALYGAVKAGLNMDMGSDLFITSLKKSFTEGIIFQKEIDQACRMVLEAKYKLGLFDDTYKYINIERSKSDIFSADNVRAALDTAQKADVIVTILGELIGWSGEAASRSDISLPECWVNLLKALLKTEKPVVLVLVNGRPLTLPWEDASVSAIVEAWNGGLEAGNATADVLFGDYNPSGKLTATFLQSVGQIPVYYNHRNTGRPIDPKKKYTSKYLDISNDPVYPFGYGLSYTTFEYADIKVNKPELKGDEALKITISITKTGNYAGEETAQLYIQDPVASIPRPVKELKGFKKVFLQPGEKKEITFTLGTNDLKFYNSDLKYDWEPGEFVIYIGTNSRDVKSVKVNWIKK